MNDALHVSGLMLAIGGRVILQNVSFTVPARSVCCVLGASGSGKTTLLRSILGLFEPTSGSLRIHDMPRSEYDFLTNVGVVYQYSALMTALSVFENVAYPLREYGGLKESEIERLVYDALRRSDLANIDANLTTTEISGGMAKRVAMARAIVLDPSILFLDEPTSGLDPRSAMHLGVLIKEFHAEGNKTVVLTTHDRELVDACCDYAIVVENKTVVAHGSLDDVRHLGLGIVAQFGAGVPDGKST